MLENINNEWHKLSDTDKPLNSGHEYIIADETRDGSCRMIITGWYDAGDIITLEADVPEVDENITEDQRLLNFIFGSKVDVTVPQSGFYKVTN